MSVNHEEQLYNVLTGVQMLLTNAFILFEMYVLGT